MWAAKVSFPSKKKKKTFLFSNNKYRSTIQLKVRFRMSGVLVAEMHPYRLGFRELKSGFVRPYLYAIYTALELTFDSNNALFERKQIRKSPTYNEPLTPAGRHFMMLFIFSMNSVTDRMLPCGIPISCLNASER